jgi:hypothetical protein
MRLSIPVAFGLASFASSAMQSIFITHYVTLYMDVYMVPTGWFLAGQTVFLVWNSLNDPLFGHLVRWGQYKDAACNNAHHSNTADKTTTHNTRTSSTKTGVGV